MKRKKILIVDESELFRDYLKARLLPFVDIDLAINGLDAVVKMRNGLPDLVILDYHLSRKSCKEVLEEKNRNPNTATIPVILTAQKIDKNRLLELVPLNIRKVFMKPIKAEALLATLGELLGVELHVEATPCVVEAHVNDDIVFIEIAKGLNREKIGLLRFKIAELLELYQIKRPRILAMLSDMELSFVDGSNLEALLRVLLDKAGGRGRNIKILTNSSFTKEFVKGIKEFSEIEVLSNLQYAVDGLLLDEGPELEGSGRKAQLISERILSAQRPLAGGESIELRFQDGEKKGYDLAAMQEAGKDLSIAVVDDDFVIQELVKTTFGTIGATVRPFAEGKAFIEAARGSGFDLVFLDILMPGLDGFQVLTRLKAEGIDLPIIILSAVSQRESVIRAFQAGVKSYLIKPLKPDRILKKTLEILKANF